MPEIGARDPLLLLPILVGLLSSALVLAGSANRTLGRVVLALGFGFGMTLLCAVLRSAVGIYLVLNLGLVLLQGRLVRRAATRGEGRPRRKERPRGPIIPLEAADMSPQTGGKAWHLGRLIGLGMPVPPGFVVLDEADLDKDARTILSCFDALGCETVAVRSSGAREDGEDRSYAGVFETRLGVTRATLLEAVREVRRSLHSARAEAYAGDGDEHGAVVVQAMVDAEYAGVLFSEDPASTGSLMVELVAGLGEDLVSGRITPESYRFGRATLRLLGDAPPPIDLAPLLGLARLIEDGFGRPVDVEWAWSRGRFQILQARDITATAHDGEDARALVEAERKRLLDRFAGAEPRETILEQDDLAVLLPEPTTVSAAIMSGLWASGGTVDLACRALGVPYELREDGVTWVVTAFGRTFVDVAECRRRRGKGPGPLAAFRMTRSAEADERRLERFLARYAQDCLLRDAVDLSQLSLPVVVDLFAETLRRFTTVVYVEAERINIAAEYHLEAARERLAKRGHDPAEHLSSVPRTVVQEAHERLVDPEVPVDEAVANFLKLFGHRATHDFELSEPRYAEVPEDVRTKAVLLRGQERRERAGSRRPPSLGAVLDLLVDRARRFQTLKEQAKHASLREVAFLRRLLLDVGLRTGLDDLVFDLEPDEIGELTDPARLPALRRRAHLRGLAREACRALAVPARLTLTDLEVLGLPDELLGAVPARAAGELSGARVSGTGIVEGRARVLTDKAALDELETGEILVTRWTDPDWTPLFTRARGIVTEIGGWLSHAAIQAREFHLPAVVGAVGACDRIDTGDLVRLHPDGRIEAFSDRRTARRLSVQGRVVVEWDSVRIRAQLVDFSRNGVGIDVPAPHPDTGARCKLHLRGGLVVTSRLAVVRGASRLGFAFDEPLGRGQLERLLDQGGDSERRLGS
ncbi:MAG: PEP/pyruvate-binding domain-containing protein [Planctomycetota bacterium]